MGKILVCGVTCVDIVNYVEKYPVEDSDNRGVDQLITLGGNATNSASVLTQLNDHTETFMSLPSGNGLFDNLIARSGVNISRCIHRESEDVPVSTVIVSEQKGSRTILHYEGNVAEPLAHEFIEEFPDLSEYSWIHFEAKAGRQFDEVCRMMEYSCEQRQKHKLQLKLSVELEVRIACECARKLIKYADVVFVSKDFAKDHGWKNMQKTVEQVQNKLDAQQKLVICPWGELGVAARLNVNSKIVQIPAYIPRKVIDTLAAGDTFIAACLHYLNEGVDLLNVLKKACYLAGIKVGQKSVLDLDLSGLNLQ